MGNLGFQFSGVELSSCQQVTNQAVAALNLALGIDIPPGAIIQSVSFACSTSRNGGFNIFAYADAACSQFVRVYFGAFEGDSCISPTFNTSAFLTNTCNPCFHKSTTITYNGKEVSFADLQNDAEQDCVIPHLVHSDGYELVADCNGVIKSLKLTGEHLVFTQRGVLPIKEVVAGSDMVYADVEETDECNVVSVTKVKSVDEYFGLNCQNSEVLANGIKASTFEKLHAIPSFWMKMMSKVVGIKSASKLGDSIVIWMKKMKLI